MVKIKLTEEQIDFILDFIKPQLNIPPETARSIVNINKTKLINQLRRIEIYPELIPELKKEIMKYYFDSLISPGESVGITVAHSIGEMNTQLTLNTFHKCGQSEKSVVKGVPRSQELLNVTKHPKTVSSTIYLKKRCMTLQETRQIVGHNLVCLTLKDLSESIEIILDKEYDEWYNIFRIVYNNNSFEEYKHCLKIKLRKNVLFKYRIDIKEIADKIESSYDDLHCVFSTDDICEIDIFVDVSNIKFTETQVLFVTPENKEEIYLDEVVQPTLEKMVIFGIPGIENIYYIKDDKTDEWMIEADGCDFRKLLGHPIVDMSRLYSNNVWDVYENLGIEAARELLISENMQIMEGINLCHIKLLIDKMTFNGIPNSISRYTLRKDESGPLSKSSFEESTDILIKAGFAGDTEKVKGISASIICGKKGKIGSGFMDLKVDVNQLSNKIFKDDDGMVIEEKGGNAKFKSYTNFR